MVTAQVKNGSIAPLVCICLWGVIYDNVVVIAPLGCICLWGVKYDNVVVILGEKSSNA